MSINKVSKIGLKIILKDETYHNYCIKCVLDTLATRIIKATPKMNHRFKKKKQTKNLGVLNKKCHCK